MNYHSKKIKAAVSARHVHLSREHVDTLFGKGYELTRFKDLTQTGEFASNEKVSVINENYQIDNVRILGPVREETQIEISKSDARRFNMERPVRSSGDLEGSPGAILKGPAGSVHLKKGCIIANRHIHMSPEDAEYFGVGNNAVRSVLINSEKGGIMFNVFIKVKDTYVLEMHIDTDDANAFLIKNGDLVELSK